MLDYSGISTRSTIPQRQQNLGYTKLLYLFLSIQLLVALIWTSIVLYNWDTIGRWIANRWILGALAVIICIALALLAWFSDAVRQTPINMVVFALFTLCFAYAWSFFCIRDSSGLVYYSLWLLSAIVFAFFIYSLLSNYYILAIQSGIIALSAGGLVLLAFIVFTDINWMYLVLVYLGMVLLTYYLVYDLRKMVRNNLFDSGIEDPVSGSVRIWVESVLVFFRLGELLWTMFKSPIRR